MNCSKLLASALCVGTLLVGSVAHAAETLTFGIISTESSTNLRKTWEPFLDDMSKKTGYEVKPFFAADYAGVIEGMRFKKVDLAWVGNKGGVLMVDRSGGEVFAKTVGKDGEEGYYSHMIVHKDSPINNLDELFANAKNMSFGNGDPNSTSGFLVPSYYVFAQNNVNPKAAFKRMLTSNHESNALSVATKQVDVATNNSESLYRIKVTQPERAKMIKVIWTSPLIPSDPLVLRKDLPAKKKDIIKSFIYNYGVKGSDIAHEKAILAKLEWSPFKVSNNDQLIPIRQLELFRDKTKILANTQLSDAEKNAKVAEIDAALAKLAQ